MSRYANVMSTIAVFVALGGGSYAAVQVNRGVAHPAKAKANVRRGPRGPRGFRGPRGLPGPPGPQGVQGPPGVVDASAFYTKAEANTFFERADRLIFASGPTGVTGAVVASDPNVGFQITTAADVVGTMKLTLTDTGTADINGELLAETGSPANLVVESQFGLNPGSSAPPVDTTGPLLEYVIVRSGANSTILDDVRCFRVTSAGVTDADCWTLSSRNSGPG